MKITEERIERLEKTNEFLAFIVDKDKDRRNPFFRHRTGDGVLVPGFFMVNDKNQLRYIDPYTKESVSLHPRSKDLRRKCSEGGTEQEIIRQLGRFIVAGKKGFLNDYKEVWGWEYGPTMEVRKKALEIGFISSTKYPHKRFGV